MARPFRQQIDEGILDRAAGLFARRGYAKTSLQDVAGAVGLSKAGLLHHFPSKDALHEAVLAHADALGQQVLAAVRHLPPGPARDRRAVDVLVDVALGHPGFVALLLAPVTELADGGGREPGAPENAVLECFGVHPDDDGADPERLVRVLGALAALAVLTLTAQQADRTTAWRPLVVATCLDALGHRRPRALPSHPTQAEA
ncbi:TetR/AcrR family transcriptional regulator [Geodermatophilus sp. SYSU D00710]